MLDEEISSMNSSCHDSIFSDEHGDDHPSCSENDCVIFCGDKILPLEDIDFEQSKNFEAHYTVEDYQILSYEGSDVTKKWLNSTVILKLFIYT